MVVLEILAIMGAGYVLGELLGHIKDCRQQRKTRITTQKHGRIDSEQQQVVENVGNGRAWQLEQRQKQIDGLKIGEDRRQAEHNRHVTEDLLMLDAAHGA